MHMPCTCEACPSFQCKTVSVVPQAAHNIGHSSADIAASSAGSVTGSIARGPEEYRDRAGGGGSVEGSGRG